MEHLPECKSIPINQILAERGQEPMEQYASISIEKCADGCPILEKALERGRELAKEHGW